MKKWYQKGDTHFSEETETKIKKEKQHHKQQQETNQYFWKLGEADWIFYKKEDNEDNRRQKESTKSS